MNQSDRDLADIRDASKETLRDLVESVEERDDMQSAMRSLMQSDNILYAFTQMALGSPDVMRLVLESSISALANARAMNAAERELKRRADGN